MMQTIMVEILLPAIDAEVEFLLPTNRYICELLPEIILQITTVKQNIEFDKTPVLCDCTRHMILNPSQTIYELGIQNGARLLLC